MSFFQRFMPREKDFFVLFEQQAENIVAGAAALTTLLEHYTAVEEKVRNIKNIEHSLDEGKAAHGTLSYRPPRPFTNRVLLGKLN